MTSPARRTLSARPWSVRRGRRPAACVSLASALSFSPRCGHVPTRLAGVRPLLPVLRRQGSQHPTAPGPRLTSLCAGCPLICAACVFLCGGSSSHPWTRPAPPPNSHPPSHPTRPLQLDHWDEIHRRGGADNYLNYLCVICHAIKTGLVVCRSRRCPCSISATCACRPAGHAIRHPRRMNARPVRGGQVRGGSCRSGR